MTPAVSVIIVSYNTRAMTLGCLGTLFEVLKHEGVAAEVWVVDNASADGSAAAIREAHPGVKVIANERNLGFGAANNLAMTQATGDYFLLLNSDAFVKPGSVRAMLDHARAHGELGVVGPRLLNADGSLQRSCWPFPSPGRAWVEAMGLHRLGRPGGRLDGYGRWPHDTPRRVDFVIGACMMVRREAYERVGGFDERFFMYAEETDWQRRITEAGWSVAFTPLAEVTHLGGASGLAQAARTRGYFFAGLDRYIRKHHGRRGLLSLRAAMVVGGTPRTLLWTLRGVLGTGGRQAAWAKAKRHAWLVVRQLTHRPPERETTAS